MSYDYYDRDEPGRPDEPDDGCTCITYSHPSAGGDGYGGGTTTDYNGCPLHDPDFEPDNSAAIERQERAWDSWMYGE